jgi:MFS transporter, ACS family, D-galactonate transporter
LSGAASGDAAAHHPGTAGAAALTPDWSAEMSMSPQPSAIAHRRWWIGVLLGSGILVNYFDRIALSVAAPQLQQEFGLDAAQLGLIFSVFFWSYALLQIPVGVVLDRFGVMPIGRIGAALWSVATALTALASGVLGIMAARLLLGVAEAPAFPANAKATGYWFPRSERGLATAIFDSAAKFSNVIGAPLVGLAVVNFGWRGAFWSMAVLNFAYFLLFFLVYRDPSADPRLSPAEHDYIRRGGGAVEGVAASGAGAMLGYLLSTRKIWGLTIGFAAYGYSFALFLTWLPGYLVREMHMSILGSAEYTAIPWLAATITDLAIGGWLIDHLIRRGNDETRVRKTVLVLGMLLGLAVFGAAFTTNPVLAIMWISVALAGLAAAAPVGWSIPSLIAPKGGAATVGGIMNFVNNLMGAVAPIVTGFIVGVRGSFSGAFLVAGIALVIGIVAYVVLLGRIEPIPDLPELQRTPAATSRPQR